MKVGVCVAALAWLVALCIYDMRERRLPNWLTLPGALAATAIAAFAGRGLPALAGAVTLGALYLAAHAVAPAAMGAGDVKLALGVGALSGYFGVDAWLLAAIAAPLLTAVWAVVELIRRRARTVPHGPAMCIATVVAAALAII